MNSLILKTASRYLAAILLVFSIHMLLRGHNEPGGGFIGGLIGATGFVLFAIAGSVAEARKALRIEPQNLAMIGLGASAVAGLSALFANKAPFSGLWLFLFAEEGSKGLPLSSILLFDIGVYLVVMGAILTLVFAIEEEV
ncbi:Na(+)/H(+) antiporter subunit B [Rhodobacteraceae bacterium XHP0102]|nr:Na(+)/H(+) antiporter subunit B [Rhodobacteraceae bacterium XHP0102]